MYCTITSYSFKLILIPGHLYLSHSLLGHVNDRVLEQTVYNISNDIVSLVNLQQLTPFLVQHNFLTKSEQDYLSDDKESQNIRIRRYIC